MNWSQEINEQATDSEVHIDLVSMYGLQQAASK